MPPAEEPAAAGRAGDRFVPGRAGPVGSPSLAAAVSPYAAVIFDLDGVVTDTASLHRGAWREMFNQVLNDPRFPQGTAAAPFRDSDYFELIDGRTREQGVQAFLASRGAELPRGTPEDPPGTWTVYGLGALKNRIFLEEVRSSRVRTYPGTLALLEQLRVSRVPTGLVSSSRNTPEILAAAGLDGAFDTVVDGLAALRQHLPGKPDPAMFLEAARRLGIPPTRTVVIEDAVAGVRAASRGGFGLVVGIDRTGQRGDLEEAGARLVLNDVGELDIGLVTTHPWHLAYQGFNPWHEGHREALTTLGNGRMATRGAAPERRADAIHYPGTYLAGTYNRQLQSIHGEQDQGEHMVNLPNWLPLDLRFGTGGWWSENGLVLLHEHRELDLRRALLVRRVRLRDGEGRELDVLQRRFVSMSHPALAMLETTLTPRGWDGPVAVRTGIDAWIRNANIPEDAALGGGHLHVLSARSADNLERTEVQTRQSQIRVATAVRISCGPPSLDVRSRPLPVSPSLPAHQGPWFGMHEALLAAGKSMVVTKSAAIVSSHDRACSSAADGAAAVLARAPQDFAAALAAHEAAWKRLLHLFSFNLHADGETQLVLNLHVFHLLQVLSPHTAELDAGVPARGLHGEGYRGHIFWDDLFVLPLVTSRMPAVTRAVLDYRWRRLDAARDAARADGLAGALFPWRSGSDGTEETPHWLYNPFSREWTRDNSRLQRHGSLAVAFNCWQYYLATADHEWLIDHGAEVIVEVARLVSSLASPGGDGRFHIEGVVGPDEYHDRYPGGTAPGIDDNAYTNVMASWACARPARVLAALHGRDAVEVRRRLGITPEELERWRLLERNLYVPFHDGIISQFEGYGHLQEPDLDGYRRRYGNIERLDLILGSEGDSTNNYKLSKQADVLMLLYVFGEDQLRERLRRMGYRISEAQIRTMVEYYLARTVHGSTLSRVTLSSVLAASDPERAWATFREALDADLDDTQGGTTRTGVHLGAMAGTIDVVQRSFAGLRLDAGNLVFAPRLPAGLRQVSFRIRYRGVLLDIALEHSVLKVAAASGQAPPVRIRVGEQHWVLAPGETAEIAFGPRSGHGHG
ncbi:HAD-IA family hydrolase [Arthrobacter gandavensis]|uniref:HAD-IA family hydrolase n=1 Tax=Arthrobacter gandavensis TaxID=169960 RepID=UPI00188F0883|nr:HAD-IA family hydrolase [Arthrobacter gandavensis]MBF4992576.1 HAD-IA family hydrolase [Arthrobacter gandavensis]